MADQKKPKTSSAPGPTLDELLEKSVKLQRQSELLMEQTRELVQASRKLVAKSRKKPPQ